MENNKLYFPNLNGLRFIAAFIVIIGHQEQIKEMFGFDTYYFLKNSESGKLGVVLFFVLSGFLITYLLLTEEKITSTIAIKNFYKRRILRIWPLYFLLVFLSFFILPHISFFDWSPNQEVYSLRNLLFYLLVLPNVVWGLGFYVPYISQAWSIGVEEQFYFIWPFLMKYFKNKIFLLISVIAIYLMIKFLLLPLLLHFHYNGYLVVINNIWDFFSYRLYGDRRTVCCFPFRKKEIY